MKRPIFDSVYLGKQLGTSKIQGVSEDAASQIKWPPLETIKALNPAQLLQLRISRIDFVLKDNIEAMQIKLSNGTASPVFGTPPANKNLWNHFVDFGAGLELHNIQVYVNNDEALTGFKVIDASKNTQY